MAANPRQVPPGPAKPLVPRTREACAHRGQREAAAEAALTGEPGFQGRPASQEPEGGEGAESGSLGDGGIPGAGEGA